MRDTKLCISFEGFLVVPGEFIISDRHGKPNVSSIFSKSRLKRGETRVNRNNAYLLYLTLNFKPCNVQWAGYLLSRVPCSEGEKIAYDVEAPYMKISNVILEYNKDMFYEHLWDLQMEFIRVI